MDQGAVAAMRVAVLTGVEMGACHAWRCRASRAAPPASRIVRRHIHAQSGVAPLEEGVEVGVWRVLRAADGERVGPPHMHSGERPNCIHGGADRTVHARQRCQHCETLLLELTTALDARLPVDGP